MNRNEGIRKKDIELKKIAKYATFANRKVNTFFNNNNNLGPVWKVRCCHCLIPVAAASTTAMIVLWLSYGCLLMLCPGLHPWIIVAHPLADHRFIQYVKTAEHRLGLLRVRDALTIWAMKQAMNKLTRQGKSSLKGEGFTIARVDNSSWGEIANRQRSKLTRTFGLSSYRYCQLWRERRCHILESACGTVRGSECGQILNLIISTLSIFEAF